MDAIREVAEAIVNLGIADELRLAPYIRATRERPVTDSTQDDESEVDVFLQSLEQARILSGSQRTTVEKILRGDKTPRAGPPPGKTDPYLDKPFGAFRTISKIGEGGMGTVYRAERQDDLSQDYVVKVLSPLAADAATYVRFRREGEVMAALRHPNVVRVFASGEQEGLSYIVMEFVDGPTLQDLFERKQRFDWQNAAKAIRQIALALDAAHAIGVIHRDVKPQNVLLARAEGLLKVADFGLAKIHQEPSDPNVSRAGDILGSPAYIAPEQWGDHDVDPRADLFALGVVLYQLVTGVLPFRGRTPGEYAKKIIHTPFDAIELYAPDCPESMKQVIARLLEKRRENRYFSAGQVVADLERCLRGELPDIPRLVRNQGTVVERWMLLGRDQFLIGRAAQAQIILSSPQIAERHALIERTGVGVSLRELEGKNLVRVNGMRIREITLKDNDILELADAPPLRYRAGAGPIPYGAISSTPSPGSGTIKALTNKAPGALATPVLAPGLLYEAFVREEHPRAVLALVELLDETTWSRRTTRARRRLVAAGIDEDTASRAVERALATYRRLAVGLPDRLFRATHENLGPEPSTWLGWWFTSGRERFPNQVVPPGPRAQGALVISDVEGGSASTLQLTSIEQWAIGRGSECNVRLSDRSVSRRHATIHRLLTRFAIRDEGSRFGTLVREERRPVTLLRHDDYIELGRAKLLFRQMDDREGGGSQEDTARGVDAPVFDALVEMRSPAVAGALVALLDTEAIAKSVAKPAWYGPGDEEPAKVVRALLEERRRAALEALPAISKKNFGADLAAWSAWWSAERAQSGPQVMPEGWVFPVSQAP